MRSTRRSRWLTRILVGVLVALGLTPAGKAEAAINLTGRWNVVLVFLLQPVQYQFEDWDIVQSGTMLEIFRVGSSTTLLSGTIDPATGAMDLTDEGPFCDPTSPFYVNGTFAGTASDDGFEGTWITPFNNTPTQCFSLLSILVGGQRVSGVDHYKCYAGKDLRMPKFAQTTVTLADQFGTGVATVKSPKFLCNPVNKNGEGILDPSAHLVCYKITGDNPSPQPKVEVVTQLQASVLQINKPRLLCVPATKTVMP